MTIGRIYIIKNGDKSYIGSTIMKRGINRRLTHHRQNKKQYERGEGSKCASFDLLDGNETIELLEEIEFEGRKELELFKREQYWIDTIPNVNINTAYGHKDRSEYFKKYRAEHKEQTHENYLKKYKTIQIEKRRIKNIFRSELKNYNLY